MNEAPAYLPQGYARRFRRMLADADPRVAREGWHDEGWDGRVRAVGRPGTVELAAERTADGFMLRPLDDPVYLVIQRLREAERMREKFLLRQTMHKRVIGVTDG